jgi:hypothetical protein
MRLMLSPDLDEGASNGEALHPAISDHTLPYVIAIPFALGAFDKGRLENSHKRLNIVV